jgi:hypothetical protein
MNAPVRAVLLAVSVWINSGLVTRVLGGEHHGTHHRDFQGFGLKYHLGYGFGGRAVGTGPFGGYPRYGGPGHTGSFLPVGPLVVNEDVATILPRPEPGDYGLFTGAMPYPEHFFAPYAGEAAGNH